MRIRGQPPQNFTNEKIGHYDLVKYQNVHFFETNCIGRDISLRIKRGRHKTFIKRNKISALRNNRNNSGKLKNSPPMAQSSIQNAYPFN